MGQSHNSIKRAASDLKRWLSLFLRKDFFPKRKESAKRSHLDAGWWNKDLSDCLIRSRIMPMEWTPAGEKLECINSASAVIYEILSIFVLSTPLWDLHYTKHKHFIMELISACSFNALTGWVRFFGFDAIFCTFSFVLRWRSICVLLCIIYNTLAMQS